MRLAEQRMGADDDVDRAVGEALLDLRELLRPRTRRDACATLTGKPSKRSAKVLKCWRASSVVGTTTATCLPFSAAAKAARSATSVLPKPTSPQISRSIGRPAVEIVAASRRWRPAGPRSPRRGSARRIRRRCPVAAGSSRRLAQLPLGRDLDQLARHLADALLHLRLARLPAAAAEPVELDARSPPSRSATAVRCSRPAGTACRRRRSAARGSRAARRPPRSSAGRRSGRCRDRHGPRDRRSTGSSTSARKFSRLRAAAPRPHQPVAEDVLLADDREVGGLEAVSSPSTPSATSLRGVASDRAPGRPTVDEVQQLVVGQHMAQALARAFAPQRDDDALRCACSAWICATHALEDIDGAIGRARREVAALPRAESIDRAGALRGSANGVSRASGTRRPGAAPFGRRSDRAGRAAAACRARRRRASPCASRRARSSRAICAKRSARRPRA